jgi:hypothetical protein
MAKVTPTVPQLSIQEENDAISREGEEYLVARVAELKSLAERGDPWVFLCASSFLEYLAKLVNGKETGAIEYKNFLCTYMFAACPAYAYFRYESGASDLAVQMYHVLRCGIVHSFSLLPDSKGKTQGGRDRSIILSHRTSGRSHLSKEVSSWGEHRIDAAVFVAEDFVEDVSKLVCHILSESRRQDSSGAKLRSRIKNWWQSHPPIGVMMIPD